eukprot:752073-Hanusia_phi.AAC.9
MPYRSVGYAGSPHCSLDREVRFLYQGHVQFDGFKTGRRGRGRSEESGVVRADRTSLVEHECRHVVGGAGGVAGDKRILVFVGSNSEIVETSGQEERIDV